MRKQITEDIEKKFVIFGKRWSVYIDNEVELYKLSEYFDFNLLEYFQDYFGAIVVVTPIVVNCNYRLSLSGNRKGDVFEAMAVGLGGESFESHKQKALSLKAFMEPNKHIEEFI